MAREGSPPYPREGPNPGLAAPVLNARRGIEPRRGQAGETEFARDRAFGYAASHLPTWVEEKTAGAVKASDVCSLSLELIRTGGGSARCPSPRDASPAVCARRSQPLLPRRAPITVAAAHAPSPPRPVPMDGMID